jgi:hypothetical protein
MTLHKFVIGQSVDFSGKLSSMLRPSGPFEVVSVLPVDEANSPTYRVKSEAEPFARVAKETDLIALGLPPSKQTAPELWAGRDRSVVHTPPQHRRRQGRPKQSIGGGDAEGGTTAGIE